MTTPEGAGAAAGASARGAACRARRAGSSPAPAMGAGGAPGGGGLWGGGGVGAQGRARRCGGRRAPENLAGPRDKAPLLFRAAAASGALYDVRLDVVRLDGRELAVEIRVRCAVIPVRHVPPPFPPRTLPP